MKRVPKAILSRWVCSCSYRKKEGEGTGPQRKFLISKGDWGTRVGSLPLNTVARTVPPVAGACEA